MPIGEDYTQTPLGLQWADALLHAVNAVLTSLSHLYELEYMFGPNVVDLDYAQARFYAIEASFPLFRLTSAVRLKWELNALHADERWDRLFAIIKGISSPIDLVPSPSMEGASEVDGIPEEERLAFFVTLFLVEFKSLHVL